MTTPETETVEPSTLTVDPAIVEAALRSYLAQLDYDLHKNLECGEADGEDTYPEEAADFFSELVIAAQAQPTAAGVVQPEPDTERRERYAAAISANDGWVLDDGQHMLDAVMAVADKEQLSLRGEIEARRLELLKVNERHGEEVARLKSETNELRARLEGPKR